MSIWLWQVKSMDEAIAPADPTGEIRKQENELRRTIVERR
jgi:hypothetical protein